VDQPHRKISSSTGGTPWTAVGTPWTAAEKEAIKARNLEYRHEQQEAARYEFRRTMTNVITFEIVCQGLANPLMRTEAAKVAGKCTSTDIFKEKLTKPKPTSLHLRSKYINKVRDDFNIKGCVISFHQYLSSRVHSTRFRIC
jgi:hypothetical protein